MTATDRRRSVGLRIQTSNVRIAHELEEHECLVEPEVHAADVVQQFDEQHVQGAIFSAATKRVHERRDQSSVCAWSKNPYRSTSGHCCGP